MAGQDELAEVQTQHRNREERELKWQNVARLLVPKWACLSISETTDLSIFSHTSLGFPETGLKKKRKHPVSGSCVDVGGERRMGRLPWRWKATVTQITTCYNQGQPPPNAQQVEPWSRSAAAEHTQCIQAWWPMVKKTCWPHRVPLLSAKSRKLRLQFTQAHQNWTTEDWKHVVWSEFWHK